MRNKKSGRLKEWNTLLAGPFFLHIRHFKFGSPSRFDSHSRPQCLRVWECARNLSPRHAQKSFGSRLVRLGEGETIRACASAVLFVLLLIVRATNFFQTETENKHILQCVSIMHLSWFLSDASQVLADSVFAPTPRPFQAR